jgi:hypothetical protein
VLALFFSLMAALAAGLLFAFVWGICRLAQRKFGRWTGAALLPPGFLVLASTSVAFSLADAARIAPAVAGCSALAGFLIGLTSARCLGVMVGK